MQNGETLSFNYERRDARRIVLEYILFSHNISPHQIFSGGGLILQPKIAHFMLFDRPKDMTSSSPRLIISEGRL